MAFSDLVTAYTKVAIDYKAGSNPLPGIGATARIAVDLVGQDELRAWGAVSRGGVRKEYGCFTSATRVSRPILRDLYVNDPAVFGRIWDDLTAAVLTRRRSQMERFVDAAVYTAATAFAAAYDLHRPGSRKTPGTFFEILVGSLLAALTGYRRGAQVSVPNTAHFVTTDIVIFNPLPGGTSMVVPTKITTRERVVQAFVHQRLLDSAYPNGEYASTLVCVSEMQRDKNAGVNEICTPNQVRMFQELLAELNGLVYLDPPLTYLLAGFPPSLPVLKFSEFYPSRVAGMLGVSLLP